MFEVSPHLSGFPYNLTDEKSIKCICSVITELSNFGLQFYKIIIVNDPAFSLTLFMS